MQGAENTAASAILEGRNPAVDNGSASACPQIICDTVEECRVGLRGYINELEAVHAKYRFAHASLELMSPADFRDALQNKKELVESGYEDDFYQYPMSDFTEVKGMNKFISLYHVPTGQRVMPI